MVVPCPVCRDLVHTSGGYIVRHGARHHGVFSPCAGSATAVCSIGDCCGQ